MSERLRAGFLVVVMIERGSLVCKRSAFSDEPKLELLSVLGRFWGTEGYEVQWRCAQGFVT